MAKLTLKNLLSGFRSITALNENFEKLQDVINDKVLFRDNPEGEPNGMKSVLDMNGQRLLNIGGNLELSGDLDMNGNAIRGIGGLEDLTGELGAVTPTFVEEAVANGAGLLESFDAFASSADIMAGRTYITGERFTGTGRGGAVYNVVAVEPTSGFYETLPVSGLFAVLVPQTFVTSAQFGIAGDGTDESDAFQKFIDAAAGRKAIVEKGLSDNIGLASTIVIGEGTDLQINKAVTITRVGTQSPMFLNGDEGGAYDASSLANGNITITGGVINGNKALGANGDVFAFANASNIRLNNITVEDTQDASALRVKGVVDLWISDCIFFDHEGTQTQGAIDVRSDDASFPYFVLSGERPASRVFIESCVFNDVEYGVLANDTEYVFASKSFFNAVEANAVRLSNCDNFKLESLTVDDSSDDSIHVADTNTGVIDNFSVVFSSGNGITIVRCLNVAVDSAVIRNAATGISIIGSRDLFLTNSFIRDCSGNSLFATSVDGSNSCGDLRIDNCNFDDNVGGNDHIDFRGVDSVSISNTLLKNAGLRSIYLGATDALTGCRGISVDGCEMVNGGDYHVYVEEQCSRVVMDGCLFNGDVSMMGAIALQNDGTDGVTHVVISNCHFHDAYGADVVNIEAAFDVTVTGCLFQSDSSADTTGAIISFESNSSRCKVDSCIFSPTATKYGVVCSGSEVSFTGNTFYGTYDLEVIRCSKTSTPPQNGSEVMLNGNTFELTTNSGIGMIDCTGVGTNLTSHGSIVTAAGAFKASSIFRTTSDAIAKYFDTNVSTGNPGVELDSVFGFFGNTGGGAVSGGYFSAGGGATGATSLIDMGSTNGGKVVVNGTARDATSWPTLVDDAADVIDTGNNVTF